MKIGSKGTYNRHIINNMVCDIEEDIGNKSVKKMHNLYLHTTKGWKTRRTIISMENKDVTSN